MELSEIRSRREAIPKKYPEDTAVTLRKLLWERSEERWQSCVPSKKKWSSNEEIVYVSSDKIVRVFTTTEDMAAFLEAKAKIQSRGHHVK